MDIVRISMLPHCAPFPQERSHAHARKWAEESMEIIDQHPGLEAMRAKKTMLDLITLDWSEGLEAFGEHMVQRNRSWWNPEEASASPLALAAYQNKKDIVEAMLDENKMGKLIETSTLASVFMGVPYMRHFEPEVLHMLMEGVWKREDEFIRHDRDNLNHAVALKLLGEDQSDLLVQLYGMEHMPSIEHAWLFRAANTIVMRNMAGHTPGRVVKVVAESGKTDDTTVPKNPMLILKDNLDMMVANVSWQKQGDGILQAYIDHAPEKLPGFIDRLRPLTDSPWARQALPRIKAWEVRSRLGPQMANRAGRKPGAM